MCIYEIQNLWDKFHCYNIFFKIWLKFYKNKCNSEIKKN
jgi:hypothetical protein